MPAWLKPDAIRIDKEDISAALGSGTVRVAGDQEAAPAWAAFKYNAQPFRDATPTHVLLLPHNLRAPEAWEMNILALERGEWAPQMDQNEAAFRKYKKERRQLGSLFEKPSEEEKEKSPKFAMLISPTSDIESGPKHSPLPFCLYTPLQSCSLRCRAQPHRPARQVRIPRVLVLNSRNRRVIPAKTARKSPNFLRRPP